MLVCSVSLKAPRAAITASLIEAAAARDAVGTGIMFATLVDEPASAHDLVNAYLGEIMVEAATATATVNAGMAYAAAVVEAANAAEVVDAFAPGAIVGAVAETASAADVVDATVTAAVTTTTTTIGEMRYGPFQVVVTDTVINAGET